MKRELFQNILALPYSSGDAIDLLSEDEAAHIVTQGLEELLDRGVEHEAQTISEDITLIRAINHVDTGLRHDESFAVATKVAVPV